MSAIGNNSINYSKMKLKKIKKYAKAKGWFCITLVFISAYGLNEGLFYPLMVAISSIGMILAILNPEN